jgi:hypothetical protein
MRRGPRPSAPAWPLLAALAAAGCFDDSFLLGAYCERDEVCGADQCCAGFRCRPQPDHCERGPQRETPYLWAYLPCDADDECLAHGMPRCVHWRDAPRGFCTDYCANDDRFTCENHPGSSALRCVDVDEQSLCALDCSRTPFCPDGYGCREGVCVPAAAS